MSKNTDAGPLFPVALKAIEGHQCGESGELWQFSGISIREHFAGLALQGILAAETEASGYSVSYLDPLGKETYRRESPPVIDGKEDVSKPWVPNKVLRTVEQNQARAAVCAADALIAELAKETP